MHHSDIHPGLFSGYLVTAHCYISKVPRGEALLPLKAYTYFHTKFYFNTKSLISGYGEASPERCTFFRLQQPISRTIYWSDRISVDISADTAVEWRPDMSTAGVDPTDIRWVYIPFGAEYSHPSLFNTTSFQIRLFCLFRSLSFSKLFSGLDMNFC